MVNKPTLKELRKNVVRARDKEKKRLERVKLKRELFRLKNRRLISAGKGLASGVKAFGRGAAVTAQGIQKFAVERRREESRVAKKQVVKNVKKKKKAFKAIKQSRTRLVPIQKGGQVTAFREVPIQSSQPKVLKRKKKRKVRVSREPRDDFSFNNPLTGGGFDF